MFSLFITGFALCAELQIRALSKTIFFAKTKMCVISSQVLELTTTTGLPQEQLRQINLSQLICTLMFPSDTHF